MQCSSGGIFYYILPVFFLFFRLCFKIQVIKAQKVFL